MGDVPPATPFFIRPTVQSLAEHTWPSGDAQKIGLNFHDGVAGTIEHQKLVNSSTEFNRFMGK